MINKNLKVHARTFEVSVKVCFYTHTNWLFTHCLGLVLLAAQNTSIFKGPAITPSDEM